MMPRDENPFRLTKSNELTDAQISDLWVPAVGSKDASALIRASSMTPMFVMGGKGSGKSHLLRYYSFPLQLARSLELSEPLSKTLERDGYIGIYSRCGTLDQDRFEGRGENAARWRNLFAYYFELWYGDSVLEAIQLLAEEAGYDVEQKISQLFSSLFDNNPRNVFLDNLAACRSYLSELRKEVDFAINNASFGDKMDATIYISRGRILFDLPRAIIPILFPGSRNPPIFSYFLDEFESLDEDKQRYINTLVREKYGPTSFKIGARLYGIKTRETFSGGESIREGSEFEELKLDERARLNKQQYEKFAKEMAAKRVFSADKSALTLVSEIFETYTSEQSVEFVAKRARNGDGRPHRQKFGQRLALGFESDRAPGLTNKRDIERVMALLDFNRFPLLEKLLYLNVYQHWFKGYDLLECATELNSSAIKYIEGDRNGPFTEFVRKYSADMLAQLLREHDRPQIYSGIDNFLRMSEGLPRSLLNILKHSYDWSIYFDERPFQSRRVTVKAQQRGVVEAADKFFEDLHLHGETRRRVQSAVSRLARLFRINRFADKPVETSLVAFSIDLTSLSAQSSDVLARAVDASLLVRVPRGQRERNSSTVSSKFEINLILSPKWDLPIARRGVTTFSAYEAECVFNYDNEERFVELAKTWERKMMAPDFGKTNLKTSSSQKDFFS